MNANSRSAPTHEQGFRSVLVAVDLTASSDRVLGRLPSIPLADDARVTVLHVVPSGLSPIEQRSAEREAVKAVAEEVRHYRKALPHGVHMQPVVKTGASAKTISSCAAQVRADLVLMGRGSGKFIRDEFLGSTAERVIRQAKIPVLVVRLAPRSRYTRPALAIAVDEAAYRTVSYLLRLLPPPRPAITVIHACDTPYRSFIYSSLSADELHEHTEELHNEAASEVATLLRKALARASVPADQAPVWKTHIRLGAPRMIVDQAVKKHDADLLVLGTHGYSGAPYLFLGTVAGDLLRRSKCDVLVVPPAPAD